MLKKRKAIKGNLILTRVIRSIKFKEAEDLDEADKFYCTGCKYITDSIRCVVLDYNNNEDRVIHRFCCKISPSLRDTKGNNKIVYIYAKEERGNL